jgi:hypothetical protein
MPAIHPYISGGGPIVQMISHLRRSFPSVVDAGTVKRLGLAPKNESYLINILRFIDVIDSEGKKTETASKVFNIHEEDRFQAAFSELIKKAYHRLFDDHGEGAWDLDTNALITFFRQTDESSGVVGARQAATFSTQSALAGHGEAPAPRTPIVKKARTARRTEDGAARVSTSEQPLSKPATFSGAGIGQLGLSVRVEVNLPADANQETYDKIFQSIRKNLIDGQ